ncbi:TetR/AcrR family transcriptional regulator, partial [Actinophytocola sp.]|jgi:AcrR family transcriptional regulator|uniref:TetR/AcrR family transcriptional regulator n=1 Tax=Actinophytocola sp. TaxID=1872138 RepID=UPI002ED7A79D
MPEAARKRRSYHHGALREELLEACVRLIESEGIGAVSLRRVAREAGVSPGAPYHHFTDRGALLAAISVRGFEQLAEDLTAARATGGEVLVALVEAYIGFARRHKGYFQLMFRPELSQPEKHPDARVAGDAAFGVLTDAVAGCGVSDPDGLAVSLWAFAHGLASLTLDGQLDHRGEQWNTTADDLIARAVRLLDSFVD